MACVNVLLWNIASVLSDRDIRIEKLSKSNRNIRQLSWLHSKRFVLVGWKRVYRRKTRPRLVLSFRSGKRELEAHRVPAIASIVGAFTATIYFRLIERQHVSSARCQPGKLPVMELSSKRAQRDRLSRKRDTSGKNVLGMAGRGNIDEPPTCAPVSIWQTKYEWKWRNVYSLTSLPRTFQMLTHKREYISLSLYTRRTILLSTYKNNYKKWLLKVIILYCYWNQKPTHYIWMRTNYITMIFRRQEKMHGVDLWVYSFIHIATEREIRKWKNPTVMANNLRNFYCSNS